MDEQKPKQSGKLPPQALAPPVLPALPAMNPFDDSDASDSGSDDSAFARETKNAHGYEGQPHRQEDLPVGCFGDKDRERVCATHGRTRCGRAKAAEIAWEEASDPVRRAVDELELQK